MVTLTHLLKLSFVSFYDTGRIVLMLLLIFKPVHAKSATSDEDINAGKGVFSSQCQSCHGQYARGNSSLGAPALAGQDSDYILRQLRHFQSGNRRSQDDYAQQMAIIASRITEPEQLKDVAAYIESLSPLETNPRQQKNASNQSGFKLYHAYCGGCHGSNAEGNDLLKAPRLAGVDIDYLKRQYQYFLQGKRGNQQSDRLGRQMAMMAGTLSQETKVNAVFSHINSLTETSKVSE